MEIRAATSRDARAIAAIYRTYVDTSPATFDIDPPSTAEFRRRIRSRPSLPWLVAIADDAVIGFAKAGVFNVRPAYRWSVDVSVYLDPTARGRGVGRLLYDALLSELRTLGYVNAVALIAEPNEASTQLHRSFGFQRIGALDHIGFKLGQWRDVGWWQLTLTHPHPEPTDPRPWRDNGEIAVRAIPVSDDVSQQILARYRAEMDQRIHGHFDAGQATEDIAMLTPPAGTFFVLFDGATPAACAGLRWLDDSRVELKRMYVDPEFRGLGHGRALLEELETRAKQWGAQTICLDTADNLDEAMSLYRTSGYLDVEPYNDNDRAAFWMAKALAPPR